MLVLRTSRPFCQSHPGPALLLSSVAIATITITLPYRLLAGPLGLTAVPAWILAALAGLTAALRPTRVATALDLLPDSRSPSQCPGTARPLASAGSPEMWTVPRSWPWPFITGSPQRPAPGPGAAQIAGQLLAQRPLDCTNSDR